ncbi:MAG: hypothetical protein HQ573_03525 [Desulfobacteraceae bacterium]|nr:hypothetical protein [Desulfobacteraceae bacterium]
MKYLAKKSMFNYRFDFEIGYLVKSPCKECNKQNSFPECADTCKMLDEIHGILSEAVSSSRMV